MDHLRHQKHKNKQLKNSTLESENKFNLINISIYDMDKFGKKELTMKRTFTKNTWFDWYDWLINYIPESIRTAVGRVKDQIINILKTKDYSKPKRVKTEYGGGRKSSKLKIQKQSEENMIKSIKKLFKLKKENEAIKDGIIRYISTLFKQEDDYYKPIRVGNFRNNSYIKYESSRNKNLSAKEYSDKINPYLRDIITNFQKSDTWKIQLTIAINFISSKDLHEERLMHSKNNNNIEFMLYDNANEVLNELFESLLSRYQTGLETSIKGSYFIFDPLKMSQDKF